MCVAHKERGLTSHKISCREPSVHEAQHTLTTADTPAVNGRLAQRSAASPWLGLIDVQHWLRTTRGYCQRARQAIVLLHHVV